MYTSGVNWAVAVALLMLSYCVLFWKEAVFVFWVTVAVKDRVTWLFDVSYLTTWVSDRIPEDADVTYVPGPMLENPTCWLVELVDAVALRVTVFPETAVT